MPAKNSIKQYKQNSYYHIYNRGVEKRNIFLDDQDLSVFLSYLKTYIEPKDELNLRLILDSKDSTRPQKEKASKELHLKNFNNEIELLCYALMPNHFHLLIKQHQPNSMDSFLNALATRYVIYFNKKYKRVGPLFQGVYKAVLVNNEEQLLHLTRYIHLNPTKVGDNTWPSSLAEYLGTKKTPWIETSFILNYFNEKSPKNDYFSFMNEDTEENQISAMSETLIDTDD